MLVLVGCAGHDAPYRRLAHLLTSDSKIKVTPHPTSAANLFKAARVSPAALAVALFRWCTASISAARYSRPNEGHGASLPGLHSSGLAVSRDKDGGRAHCGDAECWDLVSDKAESCGGRAACFHLEPVHFLLGRRD